MGCISLESFFAILGEARAVLPQSWYQCHTDFFSRPVPGWSHEQLIQVAAVAVQLDAGSALQRLRAQLALIGPGYHETLTGCWLELLRLAAAESLSPMALAARLRFSQLPFAFYSPGRLHSAEAAVQHLPPDLRPVELPRALPDELNDTLTAFQARRLSKSDWTHRCHVKVAAAIHLLLGEQGMHVMSTGILRLNQAHEVPMTPTGGYHETLTHLWYRLVGLAVERSGLQQRTAEPERWARFYEYLDDKQLPLRFYSRERLLSWEARTGWLEPDLGPVDLV